MVPRSLMAESFTALGIVRSGSANPTGRTGASRAIVVVVLAALAGVGLLLATFQSQPPRPPTPKIVMIGIDGGDWRIIKPLIGKGKLPNLARLANEGTSGTLTSYQPTMSPQIWNTIVTGKHFLKHGVDWFAVRLDDLGQKAELETKTPLMPITSAARKVPALWDILSQAGDTVGVIGFWATWPATKVNGFMVSDRFSYSRYNKLGGADQYLEHQTYPAELVEEIREFVVSPDSITEADRARFMSGQVEADDWRVNHDIVGEFDITYAQSETYRRTGLHLLAERQPDFLAVYFQGADVTSHYFWEFMRPEQSGHDIPEEQVQQFSKVIENFYVYQDEVIGDFLEQIDDDTIVFVVSDHGFRDLPFTERGQPHISGWHRLDGIVSIWGKGIRSGITLSDVDVYDITPTILALSCLPVAQDMQGRVIEEAFIDGQVCPTTYIESYTELPAVPNVDDLQTPMDDAMLERLRSIGYIGE